MKSTSGYDRLSLMNKGLGGGVWAIISFKNNRKNIASYIKGHGEFLVYGWRILSYLFLSGHFVFFQKGMKRILYMTCLELLKSILFRIEFSMI